MTINMSFSVPHHITVTIDARTFKTTLNVTLDLLEVLPVHFLVIRNISIFNLSVFLIKIKLN